MSISIGIITYNRINKLKILVPSLKSALEACSEMNNFQIVFSVNGTDQESSDYLNSELSQFSNYTLQESNIRLSPAAARNQIAKLFVLDWICFLDDDIIISEVFFTDFLRLSRLQKDVVVWGGPNLTPDSSSQKELEIGYALQSYFVAGPIANRYKLSTKSLKGSEINISLCNFFILRRIFNEELFNENLITAEENELLYRLKKRKLLMQFSNDLRVEHFRRNTLISFVKQIYYYGVGRGQLLRKCYYPIETLMGILISYVLLSNLWLLISVVFFLLFLNAISFYSKYKYVNINILCLPVFIWIFYFCGIFRGLFSSKKFEFR